MVTPGMLQNPTVMRWLGGIEPAWTLLDQTSFNALGHPPSSPEGAIRLTTDIAPEELQHSAVLSNTALLLRAAAKGPGLKLTATGNLTRAVVAEMCDLFSWPGFDKADEFRFHKVINEPDFLPLFFVRHLAEAGKLTRRYKGHLKVTAAGRRYLDEIRHGDLQAMLFQIALWRLDLGYLGRGLHRSWPQHDIGIVLWSLSTAAHEWQPPDRLARLCAIPTIGVLESSWDSGSYAMEAKVLRPLWWFGLLDHRQEDTPGRRFGSQHFYRKTPLFDRFLEFDVTLEASAGSRH